MWAISALRLVDDFDTMQRFYEEVVGLEILRRFLAAVFFRIAEAGAVGLLEYRRVEPRNLQESQRGFDHRQLPLRGIRRIERVAVGKRNQ